MLGKFFFFHFREYQFKWNDLQIILHAVYYVIHKDFVINQSWLEKWMVFIGTVIQNKMLHLKMRNLLAPIRVFMLKTQEPYIMYPPLMRSHAHFFWKSAIFHFQLLRIDLKIMLVKLTKNDIFSLACFERELSHRAISNKKDRDVVRKRKIGICVEIAGNRLTLSTSSRVDIESIICHWEHENYV